MRLYKGYKKHYQYQTLVNLLLLLFLFVILAFVIKNYFKPVLFYILFWKFNCRINSKFLHKSYK